MTPQEIEEQVQSMSKTGPKYMMGTKAYHKLGDLSRDEPGLFSFNGETETHYIGMWVTGFGYFNVCFPKETSRLLTKEEIEKFNKKYFQIGSQPPYKLKVD